MFRLIALLAMLLALSGCANQPSRPPAQAMPVLNLAPSSLGRVLALQQRLQVSFTGKQQTLDAMLEVDASKLRLAVQAAGQPALRLDWDGHSLQQVRAPWLPSALTGERVLFDLQLVYWPTAVFRAALPAGWTLVDTDGMRRLQHDGADVAIVTKRPGDSAALEHPAEGYRLDIRSIPAGDSPP